MKPPESVIEPASAPPDATYLVAFLDDDWDHWTHLAQAPTYLGQRCGSDPRSPWQVRTLDAQPLDWAYDDSEIVILERR